MDTSFAKKLTIFMVGIAVGGAGSWYFCKTKYQKIAQEEIDSVKSVFETRSKKMMVEIEEAVKDEPFNYDFQPNKNEIKKVNDAISKNGYDTVDSSMTKYHEYSAVPANTKEEKGEATPVNEHIRVIPPEEFGNLDEHETVSLFYFADKVLTDEDYEPVDDPEILIGQVALDSFGEYEDDAVYVRNDAVYVRNDEMQSDYEILLDIRNFADVAKR